MDLRHRFVTKSSRLPGRSVRLSGCNPHAKAQSAGKQSGPFKPRREATAGSYTYPLPLWNDALPGNRRRKNGKVPHQLYDRHSLNRIHDTLTSLSAFTEEEGSTSPILYLHCA